MRVRIQVDDYDEELTVASWRVEAVGWLARYVFFDDQSQIVLDVTTRDGVFVEQVQEPS